MVRRCVAPAAISLIEYHQKGMNRGEHWVTASHTYICKTLRSDLEFDLFLPVMFPES